MQGQWSVKLRIFIAMVPISAIARSRRSASTGFFREALRPSGADRQGVVPPLPSTGEGGEIRSKYGRKRSRVNTGLQLISQLKILSSNFFVSVSAIGPQSQLNILYYNLSNNSTIKSYLLTSYHWISAKFLPIFSSLPFTYHKMALTYIHAYNIVKPDLTLDICSPTLECLRHSSLRGLTPSAQKLLPVGLCYSLYQLQEKDTADWFG